MGTKTIKPKRFTYDELQALVVVEQRRADLLNAALHAVLHKKADAVKFVYFDRDNRYYGLQLFCATGPAGGIVVQTYYHPLQNPHTEVFLLDDLEAGLRKRAMSGSDEIIGLVEAVSKLVGVRRARLAALGQS